MRTDVLKRCALLFLIISLASASALAQAGRGQARLNGVVLDLEGKPVAGATVTMQFGETGVVFDTATDKKGVWSIIGLGTGTWTVTATAPGFLPVSEQVYVRQLEANPRLTIRLEKEAAGSGIVQDEASFADLEQGNKFFEEGKYDSALTMYEEFLKKNPGAYQVYLNIGDCHREKGDNDKAIEVYNTLLENAEADLAGGKTMKAKGLAAIGLCYLRQGKFDQAQDYFMRSIEVAPEDELLPYNVAEIYFSNQDIDRAQKYFEMAIQIKPEWPDPYLRLAYVFLNKADMAKAAENLEKFIALEPDTPRTEQAKSILESIKK
ncbi:MAG: tetratricopeptide repeat protein [Candidatus Aminicenantes bacterium]